MHTRPSHKTTTHGGTSPHDQGNPLCTFAMYFARLRFDDVTCAMCLLYVNETLQSHCLFCWGPSPPHTRTCIHVVTPSAFTSFQNVFPICPSDGLDLNNDDDSDDVDSIREHSLQHLPRQSAHRPRLHRLLQDMGGAGGRERPRPLGDMPPPPPSVPRPVFIRMFQCRLL